MQTKEEIKKLNEELEQRVVQRTRELEATNQELRREIAERKHAVALLYAKEQEFRAIVENAPDQIIRYDREFRRTYVNPAVAKAYGLPAEALIGKPIGSVIREAGIVVKEDDLANFRQRITAVFDTGKSCEYELTWPMPAGTKYYSVGLFPELDLNGSVINVLGIARDITGRKRAEEALRESQQQYESLVHSIDGIVWEVDAETFRFTFVSKQAERILGYPVEQWLNEPNFWVDHLHPDDHDWALGFCVDATQRRVDHQFEYRMIAADGRAVWLQDIVTVQVLEDQSVLLRGVLVDITKRKQAEEQLRTTSEQSRALTTRLSSAREEESIRIAREIHDELGSALSSLRWDLEDIDEVIAEATDLLHRDTVRQKIEAMMRLTDTTVNTLRRIASELRPIALDELGLVEAIQWQAQQFQARTGIICQCECALENLALSPEVSTAVFRIFQEALTNILRHAQATRVEINLKQEAGEFVLTIGDNGKGITEHEKSASQALGLLGMRERAHLIGGKLNISGTEGTGTSITVQVPTSG
jgi:PAS domain S-box-containing protein